jgi:hypothetical protein
MLPEDQQRSSELYHVGASLGAIVFLDKGYGMKDKS